MKRVSTFLVALMFLVVVVGGDALAKGSSSSGSSGASSAGRASSPSVSKPSTPSSSSAKPSSGSGSSSKASSPAPRYNPVTNPKPQTFKGKSYTPPPATAKFKNSPYYGQPGFGHKHHDISNFFLWYFIFASGGSDDSDDYEKEYAGHPNYDASGFVISLVLLLVVIAVGLFAVAKLSANRKRY